MPELQSINIFWTLVLMGVFTFALSRLVGMTPRLSALTPEDTSAQGVWMFLLGFLVLQLTFAALAPPELLTAEPDPQSLVVLVELQALANGIVVLALLAFAVRRPPGLAGLGLRRHVGPFAPWLAVCTWISFAPVLVAAIQVNAVLMEALGHTPGIQSQLDLFARDDGAQASWMAWVGMAVLVPFGEELLFRGALYGGLRRLLGPTPAMLLSGLMFGLMHDPNAILPVMVLGTVLAWTYERTRSLLVPCMVHMFHNGLVLATVALGSGA